MLDFSNLPHSHMVSIPGGTYTQGPRQVSLSDFELSQYPVTQALWEAVMGEGSNPSGFAGPRRPVEQVSWYEAVSFCNRLNVLLGQACCYFSDKKCTRPYALTGELPNKGPVFYQATVGAFRLPTEAEWEYAARGGPFHTATEYAGSDRLKDCDWYNDNSGEETQPPGLLQPNALGLYEMSGNVWEWCWDWYGDYVQAEQTNPSGPQEGDLRVVRGGSWFSNVSRGLRVSFRDNSGPDSRFNAIGFRLARHFTL